MEEASSIQEENPRNDAPLPPWTPNLPAHETCRFVPLMRNDLGSRTPPHRASQEAVDPGLRQVPGKGDPSNLELSLQRAIFCDGDVRKFKRSRAYHDLLAFISKCSEAVKGCGRSQVQTNNPAIEKILALLEELGEIIDEIPPVQQPMRFGNKAFRSWSERMAQTSKGKIRALVPDQNVEKVADELHEYFCDSFGNSTRIDYGTGHETAFVVFLYCLFVLGILKDGDLRCTILLAFERYLAVMRKLQTVYLLEPAGSHGVWGLDDYQCLCFLWGSAQLIGSEFSPSAINQSDVLQLYAEEYMYFSAIAFVRKIKTGAPFSDTSPMLYDISELPDWASVNKGMFKLYEKEVLEKRPVIQHLLFGSIFTADWRMSAGTKSMERRGEYLKLDGIELIYTGAVQRG